ncbi:hypothetical protein ST201phi2-1p438 [Pseudomonas phage 201phi2-1]|uniref:Uncharacterized protein n=1 Tax=Pseudomonas phage 201phi2-1 TaxID=198110 RepID=B3FJU6_BP201|nr:hypothetical protein ST201phi2-1p438 [Pseudomonas phage 201phi2-1]ABY63261.1 hypothetical protein 201phi2-1p438 [Pseudomonas phage 201phi2-1]
MRKVIAVVMMAFAGLVQAGINSNIEYEYQVAVPKTMVDVVVTPAMCSEYSGLAVGAKVLFDLNLSDEAIQNSMVNVAADNMGNRVVWSTFHMVLKLDTITAMRDWPNQAEFQKVRKASPNQDERLYYQKYAEQQCKANQEGKTIKVLKVVRRVAGSNTEFK